MVARSTDLDLAALRLSPGEGRRLKLGVMIEPLQLGGERYESVPDNTPVELDVSRLLGGGYALHLRFTAAVAGPCMRCLSSAQRSVDVEAREVDRPGEGEELESPYVAEQRLALSAWARDAFALSLPAKILCREDCRGLCPICAADLKEAGPEHTHEASPDARWAKLRELKLD